MLIIPIFLPQFDSNLIYNLDIGLFKEEQIENFVSRSMLVNLIWSFSGDGNWKNRKKLSDFVRSSTAIQLPLDESVMTNYYLVWYQFLFDFSASTHRLFRDD